MGIYQILIIISDVKVPCHDEDVVKIHLNILYIFQGVLLFVGINVNDKTNNAVVKERNEIDISVIYNILSE